MFVVILKYKADLETITESRPEHVEFLEKFYESGKFIASGRKYSQDGGIIIADCSSLQEIEDIMKQDPFFIRNLADFECIGFEATKYCTELSQRLAIV